jgi:hypothetical protein
VLATFRMGYLLLHAVSAGFRIDRGFLRQTIAQQFDDPAY